MTVHPEMIETLRFLRDYCESEHKLVHDVMSIPPHNISTLTRCLLYELEDLDKDSDDYIDRAHLLGFIVAYPEFVSEYTNGYDLKNVRVFS